MNHHNYHLSHADLIADHNKLIPATKKGPSLIISLLVFVWLGVVVLGMSFLWEYQSTPGAVPHLPAAWPTDSQLTYNHRRPTLLMFAHPGCPCTRASINELAEILVHGPERVDARVLFFKPADFPPEWEKTDLWEAASLISGVSVADDIDGAEAKKFGAATSGYVLLYDSSGQLLFHGGITASRGHAGDNVGKSAIEAILTGEKTASDSAFVFGCPLSAPENVNQQENN